MDAKGNFNRILPSAIVLLADEVDLNRQIVPLLLGQYCCSSASVVLDP